MCGRCKKCCSIACHRGHSPRRCKQRRRLMREGERARCAYGQGQQLAGGHGNPIGEVKTVRLMSHERLQTGPAGLAAGLRYTTTGRSCTSPLRIIVSPRKLSKMPPIQPVLEGGKAVV